MPTSTSILLPKKKCGEAWQCFQADPNHGWESTQILGKGAVSIFCCNLGCHVEVYFKSLLRLFRTTNLNNKNPHANKIREGMNEFVSILFYFIIFAVFISLSQQFNTRTNKGPLLGLFGVFLHVRHIFQEQRGVKLLCTLDKFIFSGATLTDFFFFFSKEHLTFGYCCCRWVRMKREKNCQPHKKSCLR